MMIDMNNIPQMIETYTWVIWDLLALLIFFGCVYRSAARGFASAVTGLLVYVVSAAVAGYFYRRFAQALYESVVYDAVSQVLARNFNLWLDGISEARGVVDAIPFLLRMLVGVKAGELDLLPRDGGGELARLVMETALAQPVMTLLSAVCFMLIFAVGAAIMRRVAGIFTGVNRLPLIGPVNTVLGGVVGVGLGLVGLYLGGLVIRLVLGLSHGGWQWLNKDMVEATYILRLFYY